MTNKTPQIPADGIMKTHDFPDAKYYRVDCSCGNPDDEIAFSVENDDGEIVVLTYITQKTDWWADPANQNKSYNYNNEFVFQLNYIVRGWMNGLIHRIKWTWRLWIDGYLKYSSTTIMTEQQALNYAEALRSAISDLQKTNEPN